MRRKICKFLKPAISTTILETTFSANSTYSKKVTFYLNNSLDNILTILHNQINWTLFAPIKFQVMRASSAFPPCPPILSPPKKPPGMATKIFLSSCKFKSRTTFFPPSPRQKNCVTFGFHISRQGGVSVFPIFVEYSNFRKLIWIFATL